MHFSRFFGRIRRNNRDENVGLVARMMECDVRESMLAPKCRVFAASCGNLASGTFIWKPHHIFCSRLHIILSRKCHTSVCRWEVLTTFVG